jgi:hypothetical protein
MRRFVLSVVALAMPIAGTAAVLASPASASAPVSCSKISGNIATTATLKGCGGGLGKGTAPASAFASGSGTITWKGKGKGTTDISVTPTVVGQGGCKNGSTEVDVAGSVTADTSGKVTVGDPVSARVCFDSNGKLSLVKHTTLSL